MTSKKPTAVPSPRSRTLPESCARASLLALTLAVTACGSGSDGVAADPSGPAGADAANQDPTGPAHMNQSTPTPANESFFLASTVSQRVGLPLTPPNQMLDATRLAKQLAGYDPGSLLRCELGGQAAYDAAIDALGGVRWGYSVSALEDLSKPKFQKGFQNVRRELAVPGAATNDASGAAPVEIVLPDIVAVTDRAALFYSASHGLMLVDISDGQPRFECATQLPGNVNQFFYKDGHLVAMTQAPGTGRSALLHFRVAGTELRFVESVDLGRVNILDSRRFNDKLVFYTDLRFDQPTLPPAPNGPVPLNSGFAQPVIAASPTQHRVLRVFRLGDALQEEMHDTLIDTTEPTEQLTAEVTRDTPIDTQVSEAHRFGQTMWASDHYFVVTENVSKTLVSGWRSYPYSICTASHTVESPYTYCWTEYETRPNPDYTPPDNSGGDRSCQGTTLSDCLRDVARVSNRFIQVPVGSRCEDRVRQDWVCDAREQRTAEYPEFRTEESTRLYIYEYSEGGFVRIDSSVREITTQGLETTSLDAQVSTLTTSTDEFDLAVPGSVQTLYFQNGFLYVISKGVLQVYALGGSSIVRTSTLPVVNDTLQSTLFSGDRLYLSDFGWNGSGDHSTLRIVNLANPAFPTAEASTRSLPGGHRSILASDHGILTIGSVSQFDGRSVNAIKLGLFSDPFAEERAYLIVGTDLGGDSLATEESQLFNAAEQRTLLPYSGRDERSHNIARIGVSHVAPDQIVSEGAVVVPEVVQRVRSLPGASESYLSFATNSIEWLTPKDSEWQTAPVLEYFQPNAVYRLNDRDDYVEIDRLGDRCKLFFATASAINQRGSGSYSDEFDCFGWGSQAYGNRLLFAEMGIEFDAANHQVRSLSESELAETRARIAERPICLLSVDLVDDTRVDYDTLPDAQAVTCLTPAEYQKRLQELLNRTAAP
jgi:hypothetical protein